MLAPLRAPGLALAARMSDSVYVRGLEVRACCGLDAWGRRTTQPVRITARASLDISAAGKRDNLPDSLNYGTLTRTLERVSTARAFDSVVDLAEALAAACTGECHAPHIALEVHAQRALLHAKSVGAHLARPGDAHELVIDALRVSCIIGIHPWEREARQDVVITLGLWGVGAASEYRRVVRDVCAYTEASEFLTVESLATGIAHVALAHATQARVRVEKPSALMFAECPGVEIVRQREGEGGEAGKAGVPASPTSPASPTRAALALGANIGDRARSIASAIAALDAHDAIRVTDTSFLYETAPMYYHDQPRFLNAACTIETTLAPHDLLRTTQHIEKQLGRCKDGVPRNGPRAVDVDILLYGGAAVDTPDLVIPHPRIAERAFVLLPLADVWTDEHPLLLRTPQELLATLTHRADYAPDELTRVTPIRTATWAWGRRTLVMGILNATPDSFSDGGLHMSVDAAVAHARAMTAAGADVIDVGGLSTAPGAPEIAPHDEEARVVPVIRALREAVALPLSIDTYRASVARAALDAGADIVNDVSGGARDPDMLPLVAARECPVILMHMRGDASTMTQLTAYEHGVVAGVAAELGARVAHALRAGVRRYNIILDPGIGFAKSADDSVRLLRGLPHLFGAHGTRGGIVRARACAHAHAPAAAPLAHFPVLVAPSRKRFLGRLIDEGPAAAPAGRLSATLAACTAAIGTGCVDMVRVHDVRETRDAVRVADAMSR